MGLYVIPGTQSTLTTTYKTGAVVYATSGSARRGKVMELLCGPTSNPNATDTVIQYDLSRQTAAGTATAFTPNPADPADAACAATAGINATVEGTITANSSLFNWSTGQRNSLRWAAYDEAKALIWPATANSGFALRALSPAYTGGGSMGIGFIE